MSTKGIYTAVSGAMAQTQKLDTIANNLANINTSSFKRDGQVFKEYLTAAEKDTDVIQVPRITASVESFYDMQGGDRGYVDSVGTYTDFSQGSMKPTGNAFDVAVEGKGMFEVLTPEGVRYTRNGAFAINGEGRLVNKEGFAILKSGVGQPPESRFITLNDQPLVITQQGEIWQGDNMQGKLSLVNIDNLQALQKIGNSMYTLKSNMAPVVTEDATSGLHQGFLEGSNVNIVKEMTDMIATNRVFESTQKAIKSFDQMDEKLVNDVPKLG